MKRTRFHVTFLDDTTDECIGIDVNVAEGMMLVDHGINEGESGYNIRAMKSWYSEPVEDK